MNAHIIYVYISLVSNLFIVEDEHTHYLRLYILVHETFCRMEGEYTLFTLIYLRL